VVEQGPITQNPAVTFVQQARAAADRDGVSLDGLPNSSLLRLAVWDCALVRAAFGGHVGAGNSARYALSVQRHWNLLLRDRPITPAQAARIGRLLLGYCPAETAS